MNTTDFINGYAIGYNKGVDIGGGITTAFPNGTFGNGGLIKVIETGYTKKELKTVKIVKVPGYYNTCITLSD